MPATQLSADQDKGTLTASTNNFTLKSGVDSTGQEREFVEGFLATTHIDKGNDEFTDEALKQMADDINGDDVSAVFNDVDTEALREATVGNLDHNNNPASPFGDTRTVPAFKIQKADVRNTGDGEKGLWIKAVLNTGGMLDETVSAVKNSIKNDFLNAFSIEFIPQKVKKVTRGERVVRIIEKAAAKGAALTGRPMNPAATMTDAMLKSMADEYEEKNDIRPMTEEQDTPDEGEGDEPETSEGSQEEVKSLSEDIKELKSEFEDVKQVNEELKEENESLKSELEDLKTLESVKTDLEEVKGLVNDIELEDGPRVEKNQERDTNHDEAPRWQKTIDGMKNPKKFFESQGKSKSMLESFVEGKNVSKKEVKNYVNGD